MAVKLARIFRDSLLPDKFREEVAQLKASGSKSSHAYEAVARSYGFKSYAAYLASLRGSFPEDF